jgi:hypothetical protein
LKIKRENLEYSVLNNFLKNIFKDLKMKDALVYLKLTATEVTSGDGRVFSKDDNVYNFRCCKSFNFASRNLFF